MTRSQIRRLEALNAKRYSVKEIVSALRYGPDAPPTYEQVRYMLRKLGLADRSRRRPSRWTVDMAPAIAAGEQCLPRGSWRTMQRAEAMVAEAG